MRLLISAALVIGAVGCWSDTADAKASVDGWTSASTIFYYQPSTLEGEELWRVIREMRAAVAIATVNPDGSANGAVIRPGITHDNKYLMFGLGHNQTGQNFRTGQPAIIVVYKYAPDEEDKFKRNQGARLEIQYVSDEVLVKRLIDENKAHGANENTTFMRINRVFPLG
ncbi:hypothetical protein QWY20_15825 [Alkalimonas sp. MEB108]|uniref:Pyridoxamine 5'-phosphate oxidase putative domain-containing protein n=1 Tax=Alkalimonas cellulosilytica TaxID=3058395 RepID=A0ABU7J8P4_9GAMM|nr:hypothetical protein [Alkalimonas sp. MEB108]MEE2002926.1 hypothetical protein [Alkalimonas sp. MEB108]